MEKVRRRIVLLCLMCNPVMQDIYRLWDNHMTFVRSPMMFCDLVILSTWNESEIGMSEHLKVLKCHSGSRQIKIDLTEIHCRFSCG